MTGIHRLTRPNYSICAKVQKNITRPMIYRVDNIYYVINRDYDSPRGLVTRKRFENFKRTSWQTHKYLVFLEISRK